METSKLVKLGDLNNPHLTGHFVALVIGLVHTLGVRDLPGDGHTLVVRHGHADRDIDVLGRLDRDLLADLLGQNLAAGLIAVGPRVVRARGSATKPPLERKNTLVESKFTHHERIHRPRWRDRSSYEQDGTWSRSQAEKVVSILCKDINKVIHHSCVGFPWYTSPRI